MLYSELRDNALAKLKEVEEQHNALATETKNASVMLFEARKSGARAINRVQDYVNSLANSPKEFKDAIAQIILSLKEFKEAIKLEEENDADKLKAACALGGGAAAGATVAALGPTAAMAIATTFGTAATGTAISTLSGAAAANAALAWLGGGAIAAGGGGMVAGKALLALAGPIGWIIGGITAAGSAAYIATKNENTAIKANKAREEIASKIPALKETCHKIKGQTQETERLTSAISTTPFQFYPTDYKAFSREQKFALAALVNTTKSLGEKINERLAFSE